MLNLANKHMLLGVTGSIAAYKSADIVRRLREAGAIVRVAMTENAKRFITPLTLQAVSGFPVHDELFDLEAEAAMGHIELARWADVVLIAPATADFIARLSDGRADDLLTALCLATKAPVAIAPAMNQGMWKNTMQQTNLQALTEKNIHLLGPAEGSQACGDVGLGRMLEAIDIVRCVNDLFETGKLAGKRVLITAGPTHEAIDPVRFITNHSSGKMGYAIAEAAREAGAFVTLISGPTQLKAPEDVAFISVVTADEMNAAVMQHVTTQDIFISVAAVSDYRVEKIASQKIHKQEGETTLTLIRTPDILANVAALSKPPYIVGFAAETDNVIAQAKEKRIRKKMDMIVANQVGDGLAMGSDDNEVTVIAERSEVALPKASKKQLARQLIELVAKNNEAY